MSSADKAVARGRAVARMMATADLPGLVLGFIEADVCNYNYYSLILQRF